MAGTTDIQKTLYLIDGHAQFFRAYHAIRSAMSSPVTKEPTNMTYGFVGMLLKVLREYKPDYLAVVIDQAGDRETFRSEIYPEYKATRKPMPDDLPPQIDRCLSILGQMKVPVIAEPGVEADDAIATIVRRLQREQPDLRIRIVSKDKDLTQLLNHNVELVDVHKDTSVTAADTFGVEGVKPEHVIDILTLMGDTIDNVPGVPGVGPKTAAELILKYGSVANLLTNLGEIKGKRRENIEAAKDKLALSAQLVRLKDDLAFEFDLEAARSDPKKLPAEELLATLREVGFNRYQNELKALVGMEAGESEATPASPGESKQTGRIASAQPQAAEVQGDGGLFDRGVGAAPEPPPSSPREGASMRGVYETITTIAQLEDLIWRIRAKGECALDTETCGLSFLDDLLCGVSIAVELRTGAYIAVRSPTPDAHLDEATVIGKLKPILEDAAIRKVGHNVKFDMNVLRRCGVRPKGFTFDTMIASYVIDATRSSHSLDPLALALLNYTCIPITDLIGSGRRQRSFESVPLEKAAEYSAEDADITLRLRDCMVPTLKKMGLEKLFHDVEMPLVEVLAEIEWNGIRVDPDELDRQRAAMERQVATLKKEIQDQAPHPFNPDSTRQLAAALFNKPAESPPGLGLRPLRRGKTGPSTDQEVLEKLAGDPMIESPIPRLIVEYRQLTKLVSTYLVALKDAINPLTGRIHASFNQTVAVTGRLSSSDPNLQNIPIRTEVGREIRRAFVAEKTQCNWLNGFEREITAEAQRARSERQGDGIAGGLFASAPRGQAASNVVRPLRVSDELLPEEPNVLITADYSQIELRLLAHLSNDPALIEAFHKGRDIHTAVAAEVFGVAPDAVSPAQRNSAKMVNFGIVYGITPFGLARRLQMAGTETTNEEAGRIIAEYKHRYSGIAKFLQACIHQAMDKGCVETVLGRRRPIPEVHSNNPATRALGERYAINTVVQGSAADLIKKAMIDIQRALGDSGANEVLARTRMLLQIHDELVFESPRSIADEVMAFVREHMQGAMTLNVPLVVEAAWSENWIDAK